MDNFHHTRRSPVAYSFVAAVLFYILNVLTPYTLSDDILYKCVWQYSEQAPKLPLHSFSDLVQSQWVHYHVVNGRIWVHTLVQLFAGFLGKDVYNLCQATFFFLFIRLAASLITDQQQDRRYASVCFLFAVFILIPCFSNEFLWFVAGFNYLWVSVVVLAFLLRFKAEKFSALTACLALLAGSSHEGIALSLSFASLVWLYDHRRTAAHSPQAIYILLLIASTVLCVYPPLVINRAGLTVENLPGIVHMRLLKLASALIQFRTVYLFSLLMLGLGWKRKTALKAHIARHRYLYITFLTALLLTLASGSTETRALFFPEWLSALLLVSLITDRNIGCHRLPLILPTLIMLAVYVPAVVLSIRNYRNYVFIERQLHQPGSTVISVRQIHKFRNPLLSYIFTNYVREPVRFGINEQAQGFDPGNEYVRCAEALYGKPQLCFLPEELARLMKNHSRRLVRPVRNNLAEIAVVEIPRHQKHHPLVLPLRPEPPDTLPFVRRLTTYAGNTYDIPDGKYAVITLSGHHYLVFCLPPGRISRRLLF